MKFDNTFYGDTDSIYFKKSKCFLINWFKKRKIKRFIKKINTKSMVLPITSHIDFNHLYPMYPINKSSGINYNLEKCSICNKLHHNIVKSQTLEPICYNCIEEKIHRLEEHECLLPKGRDNCFYMEANDTHPDKQRLEISRTTLNYIRQLKSEKQDLENKIKEIKYDRTTLNREIILIQEIVFNVIKINNDVGFNCSIQHMNFLIDRFKDILAIIESLPEDVCKNCKRIANALNYINSTRIDWVHASNLSTILTEKTNNE